MSEVEGGDYELAQTIEAGTKDVLIPSVKSMGETLDKVAGSVGTGADRVADTTLAADATATQGLHQAADGLDNGGPGIKASDTTPGETPAGSPETPAGIPEPGAPTDGAGVPEAGVESTGASSAETGGTDPIDVVSGQLLTTATDLALPGVLPVILRRAYASSYQHGSLFGPGWSSTLDIRILVRDGEVRFLGDDAQELAYPLPPRLPLPVFPAHGARWPLVYADGEYRITEPESGLSWSFTADRGLDGVFPLSRIADRNGNRIEFRRDEDGLAHELVHSGGYRIAVSRLQASVGTRAAGLQLLDSSGDGLPVDIVSYTYDDYGRLDGITDSTGVPLRYSWTDDHKISGWTDRSGYGYWYRYDTEGRVSAAAGDGGYLTSSLEYDREQRRTIVTDSLGNTTAYHYDQFQHVTKTVDALGGEAIRQADRYGRLSAFTDQAGNTIRIDRDGLGNPVRVEQPDGSSVTTQYNEMNLPAETVGPDGGIWRYTYDARGNRTTRTDPTGATYAFEYGEHGEPLTATDPLGSVTRFETDPAGLPVAVIDPLGAITRASRDSFGRITKHTDALGNVTETGWSVEGLLSWRVDANGAHEQWAYDASGNLVQHRDALGNVSTTEYGPFGRPIARVGSTGTRYEFSYDAELRLAKVTNPEGAVWQYDYDALGRVSAEQDFNQRTLNYRYDEAGHLVERVNGLGQTTVFAYDAMGRLVERRAGETLYQHSYDSAGRMLTASGAGVSVSYTRDGMGRVLAETVNGRSITYRYDAAGRRTDCRTPSGAASRWSYDDRGLPTSLVTATGTLAFERDAVGRETLRQLGYGSLLTQSFDPVGRLVGQEIWPQASAIEGANGEAELRPLQHRSYAYRDDGMLTQIGDALRGTRNYTLDRLGRVTAVQAETWNETYVYDTVGNLAHASAPGEQAARGDAEHTGTLTRRVGRTTYEHDAQGRVTRAVTRTLSGQTRQRTYEWDADDRLTRVTTPEGTVWHYAYDPLGRRSSKAGVTQDGAAIGATHFTWDGARLVEQTAIAPDGTETILTWDYEPGTYRPAAQTRRNRAADASQVEIDAEFYAIVADAMGTPQELVAADGRIAWHATTSLWGEPISSPAAEIECPLGFPGQYYDRETGLHYNYYRYYDSASASYLAPDPLGFAPSTNHHSYVPNPTAWCDPLGLDPAASRLAIEAAPGKPELTEGPVAKARSWQGSGRYPGVDDYKQVDLKQGDVVYGGYPYPTEYFTTPDAVALADGDATKLYEGLQVAPYQDSYRPQIRAYTVTQDTTAAYGLTEANPQFGSGGLPQLFIPNWQRVLKPGDITDMQNWNHAG